MTSPALQPAGHGGDTRQALEDQDGSFEDALARSYDHVDRFVRSADLREGVASFLEKRPPAFLPLDLTAVGEAGEAGEAGERMPTGQ